MPRGGKRPGAGGKPGVPHKLTSQLRFDLIETLRDNDFDPVFAIVDVYRRAIEQHEARLKTPNGFGAQGYLITALEAAKTLTEFVYPKRKAVEVSGVEGADLFQSFTDLVKEIASEDKK